MPIDSSIYSNQTNVADAFGQGMALAGQYKERKQRDKQQAEQQAIKDAYNEGMVQGEDGKFSFDADKSVSALAGKGFGQEAYGVQKQAASDQAKLKDAKIATQLKQFDFLGQVLGGVKNEQDWETGKSQVQAAGIDLGPYKDAPYSPQLAMTIANRATNAKDQIEMQFKQQGLDIQRERLGIDREKASKDMQNKSGKVATDLRKERSGLDTTRSTQKVSAAYNRILEAAKDPSAAGDLSLIFNYMKMLDPGSTVREGEFANAENSAGVDDRLRAQYNKIKSGQRLTKGMRDDFIKQSQGQYQAQKTIQDQIDGQYRQLAEKAGIDPNEVILNFNAQKIQAGQPDDFDALPDDRLDSLYQELGGQ